MIRINMLLPSRMYAALKAKADELGLTLSEVVRRAIDDFLNRE